MNVREAKVKQRIAILGLACLLVASSSYSGWSSTFSLDGEGWLLGTDPENIGRDQQWFQSPTEGAKPARVPGIIQEQFPGYHGVAWFWREFESPANPHVGGRYLLRFWQVDYLAGRPK